MNPLTPPDCDLRDFQFMPLDVVRLRDSDLATKCSGEEAFAAVLLWCAAWHQVPAASLPDDDALLAQFTGYGRVVREWLKVRPGALRGWVKCSDGRLYHPVVAEKALDAWNAKLQQRWRSECARIKKAAQRSNTTAVYPTFEEWAMSRGTQANCPPGQTANVPGDSPAVSPQCPPGNGIQGTGIGTGRVKEEAKAAPVAPVDFRADLFARWKALPDSGGGAYLSRLIRDHGEDRALQAVERTLDEPRADPKAFVQGVLRQQGKTEAAEDDLWRRAL